MKFTIFLISLVYSVLSFSQEIEIVKPKEKKTVKANNSAKSYNWREKYDDIGSFEDGVAYFKKNGKYGFVNSKGQEIVPNIYDEAYRFSEGLAIVKQNEKCGFIDKNGNVVIPIQYDFCFNYSEGLAAVKQNGNLFLIDRRGNCVKNCNEEINKLNNINESRYGRNLENDLKIDAKKLKFIKGTDSITKIGLRFTTRIAANLADATFSKLKIISHIDNGNYVLSNKEISYNRAKVIKKLLSDKGVYASKIEIEAKGDTEPLESNDSEIGREINNRIELILIR